MPPYLEYTMSKPQSPRSVRPPPRRRRRDGSFSRPKGEARATVERSERPARASGPDGGRGGHAEPRARAAGRRDEGRAPAAANTAATSARTVVANTKAIVSTPARIAASKAAVARGRAYGRNERQGDASRREAPARAARKDAGNTPAMIVRMRAGEYAGGARQDGRRSRAVTIASRIAVVNTTTTAATVVRRGARNTPGTIAAMAVSTGVASRAMPVGAMNATASAPIRTGRAARIAKAPFRRRPRRPRFPWRA